MTIGLPSVNLFLMKTTTTRDEMVNEVVSVAREMLISKLGRAPTKAEIVAFVPLAYTKDAARLVK